MLRFESKALVPILVMVGLGGCALPGSYTVRECPPNPTAYVFHTGVGETKEAIRRTFPKGFKFVADRTPIMTGDFMPIDASHEMVRVRTVGKGRLVVWGGEWSTAAGQWVTSTKFVPWLQSLFERLDATLSEYLKAVRQALPPGSGAPRNEAGASAARGNTSRPARGSTCR